MNNAQRRRTQIESALENDARIVAIFSHLGTQGPNKEARRISDQLMSEVNSAGDILDFRYEGLRENFDHRNIASGLGVPDHELVFQRWVTMNDFRSDIMGIVAGRQLADMVESFNERLFDKNIRSVLKSTETNDILDATLRSAPSDFWYFNNGITIPANSISCQRLSPRATEEAFMLQGLSVVNGAQTCGALARAQREGASLEDVRVTVRAISTERHSTDFDKQVTRYTNTQNQITNREFVSLDAYQQELSDILLAERIQYQFRTGQGPDAGEMDFAFDLEEATRALACYTGVSNATRAKREIGRMWADLNGARYLELFPRNLDAAEMYNAVRFWREFRTVLGRVVAEVESREGRILQNAEFLGCALLMQFARQEGLKFREIDAEVEQWVASREGDIRRLATIIVDAHEEENPGGYPMSIIQKP